MKITFQEILEKIDQLLEEKISRKMAPEWAKLRIIGMDNRVLEYEPVKEEQSISNGLFYLEGFDLLKSPNSYLFRLDDLRIFKVSLVDNVKK